MAASWARRRGAFSHDWLKNSYLPALEKWVNILSGDVDDSVFEGVFARTGLHEWNDRRDGVTLLLAEFETAMSPRVLFESEPLSGVPDADREWLAALVHDLWLQRNDVRSLPAGRHGVPDGSGGRLHSARKGLGA